ncbi:hypothetical protein FACS1894200_01160 [Spirochaetia bacterium]|nr:hypothetical protein FACS1894200_01160 [Spirochaetia bacterium]
MQSRLSFAALVPEGESKLLTSTPPIEEFLPSDQGKRVAYSALWENEKR